MNNNIPGTRMQLVRDVSILQFKLLVDGLRDAALIPVSILAALLGLSRGGTDADREFRRVLKFGRRSERWINLFGHQPSPGRSHPAGSLDVLLDRVESVVVDQYRKGLDTEHARAAITAAMEEVTEENASPSQKDKPQ